MFTIICDTTTRSRTHVPSGAILGVPAISVTTAVVVGATALGTPAWSPPVC